jgi:hypothetical protein
MSEWPHPDYARNMRIIAHSDQGGRADGMQLMVHRGYAYISHMFSGGFSVLDVRDAKNPGVVNYTPAPANTWTIHLQTHDDLLLVINAKDMFGAEEFADERAYYSGALGKTVGTAEKKRRRDWSAGLAVYDISEPDRPRQIGFMPVEGGGIHRLWYTIDMSDPALPVEAGRWWIPGMNLAAGETPSWPAQRRNGLHHVIVHGDTAYAAWRDAGMVVLDVADRATPKLIVHKNWSPPFGGGTHNCLPLPDRDLLVVLDEAVLDHQEDGLKLIWIFDNRARENPVSISSCPTPAEADYKSKEGHFGPHNIHENRPGSFVSSQLIFATYQNAGIRVFDISDAFAPRDVGALVPAGPARGMDKRPNRPKVIQSADVFVDASGLIYATDYNAGLYIAEFGG